MIGYLNSLQVCPWCVVLLSFVPSFRPGFSMLSLIGLRGCNTLHICLRCLIMWAVWSSDFTYQWLHCCFKRLVKKKPVLYSLKDYQISAVYGVFFLAKLRNCSLSLIFFPLCLPNLIPIKRSMKKEIFVLQITNVGESKVVILWCNSINYTFGTIEMH